MVRPVLACGVLLAAVIVSSLAWPPAARTGPPRKAKSPARSVVAAAVVAADPEIKVDHPADKVRQALDQVINLEFDKQPLSQVVERLHKATKVPFVIDRQQIPQPADPSQETQLTATLERVKLRDGLHAMLSRYNFGYAVVNGKVLITMANMAIDRQVGQLIRVNIEEMPLAKALEGLGRQTCTNILLDRRAAKEGQTKLTMHLEDVPLESAVRLLAEMANLKLERVANVLFVTTPGSAAKLRAENTARSQPVQSVFVAPCMGGFGALGAAGGFAGLNGCCGGALGIGGGGIGGLGALGAPGAGGDVPSIVPTGAAPARPGAARQEAAAALALALVAQDKASDQKAGAAPMTAAPATPQVESAARLTRERVKKMRNLVDTPITADFPPGATIKEAIDYLQQLCNVTILVDEQAWKDDPDLKDDFPEGILNQPIKLPKMTGVRFATVLRLLFGPVGGDFQLRADFIMVLPRHHITSGQVLRQPVDATFEGVPLSEALEHLAGLTGVTIVLDPRTGDDAQSPVKAAFDGLPLESAVRMLADMAGLKPVRLDNGLYITSKDIARALQAEQQKRKLAMPKIEPAGAADAKAPTAPPKKGGVKP